jgi:DNA-binding transcriptional ArsR family regulator
LKPQPHVDLTQPHLIKALAHPLRVRILSILEERTASPSEIATELNASLGVVSYHVRKLHSLKLLKLVKKVPRRGAVEHYYKAENRRQVSDEVWAEIPDLVKRATVGAVLSQVAAHVNSAAVSGGFERPDVHVSRTVFHLDERGWSEIAFELATILERVDELHRAAAARLEESGEDPIEATLAVMYFESAEAKAHDGGAAAARGKKAATAAAQAG